MSIQNRHPRCRKHQRHARARGAGDPRRRDRRGLRPQRREGAAARRAAMAAWRSTASSDSSITGRWISSPSAARRRCTPSRGSRRPSAGCTCSSKSRSTSTTARADALIAATDRAGVKLGVFFQDRLKPDVVKMKAMVDAGVAGRPILASGRVKWYRPPEYYGGSRWRGTFALDGGGALINQAIHTLDVLLHLWGPIVSVDARAGTQLHTDRSRGHGRGHAAVRERRAWRVRSLDGGLSRLRAPRRADGRQRHAHARARQPRRRRSQGARPALSRRAVAPRDAAPAVNAASPTVSDATPHRRIIEDFLHAIAPHGRPACDGPEGRRSVVVIDAIYASARAKGPVTIE